MKNTSKDAYYERLRNLADINKTSVKEATNRTLGTLIDYKRAVDGVAYGIIKENHQYYIKKGGTKSDPDVADFAYIGGLSNIKDFQFKSLAEADKQRNMHLHTISESFTLKPNKTTKKRLLEDKAGQEIDAAQSKFGDLETATASEKVSDTDQMAAGLESEPNADMPPAEGEPMGGTNNPNAEGGEMPPAEGGEMSADGEPTDGEDTSNGSEGQPNDGSEEKGISEDDREIRKAIGKLAEKIRKTELTPEQDKLYVNSFLSAFKEKFPEVDIDDRKKMANRILKVVPPEDIENLHASMPSDEMGGEKMAAESVKEKCNECGTFAKYAESRGYDSAESLMECGEEEVGNLVSGYANAHNAGQNNGDLEGVALVVKIINPEILNTLKTDYGHEDYSDKLSPYVNSMNESSEENIEKLNELFGGLKNMFGKVGGDVGKAVGDKYNAAKTAVGDKYNAAKTAVGNYATDVKQSYHQGEVGNEVKKLESIADNLGQQIAALNTRLKKANQPEVPLNKLLQGITNQVIRGGKANVGGTTVGKTLKLEDTDPAYTETQPNMNEDDEEMDTVDSVEADTDNDTDTEVTTDNDLNIDDNTLDLTKGKPSESIGSNFSPAFQAMGGGVVKPDGAPTTVKVVGGNGTTVDVNLSEAKRKLIKQIAEGVNDYMTEISTGLASKSFQKGLDKAWDTNNDPAQKTKLNRQADKFSTYINPELSKYLESNNIKAESWGDAVNLKFPDKLNPEIFTVEILVKPNEYRETVGEIRNLPHNITSKLPNIIKKVQADLRGEKSVFNPASPPKTQSNPHSPTAQAYNGDLAESKKAKEDKEIGKKDKVSAVWKDIKEGEVPLTESEIKIRKYIRQRLEEHAGIRKPNLNEGKKSQTLQKLDNLIDRQYKLQENVVKNKIK